MPEGYKISKGLPTDGTDENDNTIEKRIFLIGLKDTVNCNSNLQKILSIQKQSTHFLSKHIGDTHFENCLELFTPILHSLPLWEEASLSLHQ